MSTSSLQSTRPKNKHKQMEFGYDNKKKTYESCMKVEEKSNSLSTQMLFAWASFTT